MEKFKKGNKNGEVTKMVPEEKEAYKNVSDGSMDYMSKQDGFCSKDATKINRGRYKDPRYS